MWLQWLEATHLKLYLNWVCQTAKMTTNPFIISSIIIKVLLILRRKRRIHWRWGDVNLMTNHLIHHWKHLSLQVRFFSWHKQLIQDKLFSTLPLKLMYNWNNMIRKNIFPSYQLRLIQLIKFIQLSTFRNLL